MRTMQWVAVLAAVALLAAGSSMIWASGGVGVGQDDSLTLVSTLVMPTFSDSTSRGQSVCDAQGSVNEAQVNAWGCFCPCAPCDLGCDCGDCVTGVAKESCCACPCAPCDLGCDCGDCVTTHAS